GSAMLRWILILTVAVAALVMALLYSQQETGPLQVSGFLEADEIRVGSRVGGRVQAVAVQEGDETEPGEVLLQLEPFDLLERQAEAQAELASLEAEFNRLQAGFREEEIRQAKARVDRSMAALEQLINGPRPEEIRAAEKEVEEARARLEVAQMDYSRIETLAARGAATTEELDQSRAQLKSSRASTAAQQERLNLLLRGTREEEIRQGRATLAEAQAEADLRVNGYRTEEIARAKAARDAARAALQALERQIEELTVRAPSRAVIDAVDLEPGDLIGAGVPALSLILTENLRVRAYVPEDALNLKLGQKVWVTVDSFPRRQFAAHISFVSRQAEFTPRNVQTPEERSKQVFRIRAMLDEGLDELRPGMAADVWLTGEPPRS
ncbi:MAG: HlyD family efflux transporter periplasmic adaptor subunit, partial [Planctomycetaceae bacterium]|nr:HlyD family efflux transporter periplasmic adaptor subunit [Planctomycetaceae bacterium]